MKRRKEFIKLRLEKVLSSKSEEIFISAISGGRVRENWLLLQLDLSEHKIKGDSKKRLVFERIHLIADSGVPKTQVLEWKGFCAESNKRLEITCWCANTKEARVLKIFEFVEKVYAAASTRMYKVCKRAKKDSKKETWSLRLIGFEAAKKSGRASFICELTK